MAPDQIGVDAVLCQSIQGAICGAIGAPETVSPRPANHGRNWWASYQRRKNEVAGAGRIGQHSALPQVHWRPCSVCIRWYGMRRAAIARQQPRFPPPRPWEAVQVGDYPEFEFGVQLLDEEDEFTFPFELSRLGGPKLAEIPISRSVPPVRNNQRYGIHRTQIDHGRARYFRNLLGLGSPVLGTEASGGYAHYPEQAT